MSNADVLTSARAALGRRLLLKGLYTEPVLIESISQEGALLFLRVRTADGRPDELTVEPDELHAALAAVPAMQTLLAPPDDFALMIESERIRLAYAFDPYFAVSLSGVRPLPHQLEAVYERMLPQVRLRFLLADDPGAGKTIMAGLLLKELKLRGAIERVLILAPAPLTFQWQDELRSKFDEVFEVIRSDLAKNQLAGNVWDRFPQCIVSIDFAKQDDVAPGLLRAGWDLVIVDEAHKCAARLYGAEVKRTRRYALVEQLSELSDRMLLLTATPHAGNVEQFNLFLQLLDADQFANSELNKQIIQIEHSPWFLRRMKEELRDLDGRPLFTERHPITVRFELSRAEMRLYRAVTEYINDFLPHQKGRRKVTVALARMVLQRRLASSLYAIARSLRKRRDRFAAILDELDGLRPAEQARRLQQLRLLDVDDEQDEDDHEESELDELVEGTLAIDRVDQLRIEVIALRRLVDLAEQTIALGEETKLRTLQRLLEGADFDELRDGRGKLLIFTEHKDTLDYLRENLERWSYTTCEIHGGMNVIRRKEAQDDFRRDRQICIATEAAGEGINLQFCHLMINYDIPWNPNRLEQRMGRIHRIGQQRDVYIFNFVAEQSIDGEPIVEGKILARLLMKLEEMRAALGNRVFDVIGQLLRLNEVDLEEMLREATYNPKRLEEYEYKIAHLSPERLRQLEEATGVALATSKVDLALTRQQDYRSEERRLMPQYVEQFFMRAADRTGLRVEQRADALLRIEHVPERFRAPSLQAVRRFGTAHVRYSKLTFRKEHLEDNQHLDAELLSPGHALFAAVTDVLDTRLEGVRRGAAFFIDPQAIAPYSLHFFRVEVQGEEPGPPGHVARSTLVHATITVVLEGVDGSLELTPPDVLHDLTPGTEGGRARPPDEDAVTRLERWVRANLQHNLARRARTAREREIAIRRTYLDRSFATLINTQQAKWADLMARVADGRDEARLARDEAEKRVYELEARHNAKLAALEHLAVVRPGLVRYLGSALVAPAQNARIAQLMRRDDEVERIAMEVAIAHERARGWAVEDVSRLRDGSGFDLRSLGPADSQGQRPLRRIEVKGRAAMNEPVVLTPNEWLQAGRHGDSYWLYVVWGCKTSEPQLITVQNPVRAFGGQAQLLVEVKGWLLGADELKRQIS
jgi:superfamily II DNA or RNA helicase